MSNKSFKWPYRWGDFQWFAFVLGIVVLAIAANVGWAQWKWYGSSELIDLAEIFGAAVVLLACGFWLGRISKAEIEPPVDFVNVVAGVQEAISAELSKYDPYTPPPLPKQIGWKRDARGKFTKEPIYESELNDPKVD